MQLYKLLPLADHELCQPEDWKTFDTAISEPGAKWKSASVRIVHWDQGVKLARSDSPWWGSHVLVLRRPGAERLRPYLTTFGQLLELECAEAELVAFRANRILEGALSDRTEADRYKDGSLSIIWKHVFNADVVRGSDVFKLKEIPVGPLFVNDEFVKEWQGSGLVGLDFEKVWEGS